MAKRGRKLRGGGGGRRGRENNSIFNMKWDGCVVYADRERQFVDAAS